MVLPLPALVLSAGSGETNPFAQKNVAAMFKFVDGEVATVIVPFESAVPTGAEKRSVLTPLVLVHDVEHDPMVLSLFFVYEFPTLSVTVMVGVRGSVAIATKTVFPAATVTPV